jgi:cation-transporting ATPase I
MTTALVEVKVIPQTGIAELIAAAHQARMRVVIASQDETILHGLPADDTIAGQDGMLAGIHRLQREGRVVCLVAGGDSPGLGAADCAVSLVRPKEPIPWGAHILCRDDLSDVQFLIHACASARQIAKQSVNIALGAATLGALVSAGGRGPMTTGRVLTVVNTASLLAMLNGARVARASAHRVLSRPRDRTPWHALASPVVLVKLGTTEQGLSRSEAAQRGRRVAPEKSSLAEFGEAFTNELFSPLALLLAAGAGLSAVVGSMGDAAMVGAAVSLNAFVGSWQSFRTERAIRDLARTARRRARALRGGEVVLLDATQLVRGDVVLLGPGDVVPADCRILECTSLEVDASSLTGESMPVRKSSEPSFELGVADHVSMLHEGTSIASGSATGIVVGVGEDTEAQRAALAAQRGPMRSGVERRLRSLINLTGPIALGAGAGLVGAGLLRGRKLEDLVGSGVSLAVASVPEGLPLLATAAQLAAAERLSQRGALVRNARSIEALGRVDVLCVDKTGTVTLGRIELSSVSDGVREEAREELKAGRLRVLAAALRAAPDPRHTLSHGDPTDAALLRSAARLATRAEYGCPGWRPLSELSFEAGRGYHAVLGTSEQGSVLSVKGAPEVILPRCSRWFRGRRAVSVDAQAAEKLKQAAASLARRGLRVLAVAERIAEPEDSLDASRLVGLTFFGFLAFSDPVRPTAARAIERLRAAGIKTLMVTGDHPSTAEAIATELDLLQGASILTGAELARMSDETLDARVNSVNVFARVTPSQKVRVVRSLQRAGKVVAMVGDGVNDAPAIRLANVGIAIGDQSTAAARSAADIVLTDERIETLVLAIAEGRAMWAAVRDAVSILLGGNLGEIAFTVAGGLIDGKPPLNSRQLLLVNLFTDIAPAMAIALRPPSPQTLESLAAEGPDVSLGELLNRDIAARAVVTAMGAGAAWLTSRALGMGERSGTVGLLALVGTQLGQTVLSGGASRQVLTTSVSSVLALGAIVQTPWVSQLFGCRPVGAAGWITAIGASSAATAASILFPDLAEDIIARFGPHRPGEPHESKAPELEPASGASTRAEIA